MNPKLIKTEDVYTEALARIDVLFSAAPGTPEADELELWVHLVKEYEDKCFHIPMPDPISAIKFRMEQQGLRATDLIQYIGSKSKVSEVLNGKRPLSLRMIRLLSEGLGIPAEVLLQSQDNALSAACSDVDWSKLPLALMLKRGWFPGFEGRLAGLIDCAEEMLGPLMFPDALKCNQVGLFARQRVRKGSQADECALLVWRGKVLSLADSIRLGEFDPSAMSEDFIRSIMRLSQLDDGPLQVRRMLKTNGIALVILNHLPGTHLDGAAMQRADGKPVVALTLRHDRLDNFWFTLAHEMAHVALHLSKGACDIFLDDLDYSISRDKSEEEADSLAGEVLIPRIEWEKATVRRTATTEDARRFGTYLHINPAIVAGRIRYERNNYRLLDHLVGRGVVRRMFPHYLSGDVA